MGRQTHIKTFSYIIIQEYVCQPLNNKNPENLFYLDSLDFYYFIFFKIINLFLKKKKRTSIN